MTDDEDDYSQHSLPGALSLARGDRTFRVALGQEVALQNGNAARGRLIGLDANVIVAFDNTGVGREVPLSHIAFVLPLDETDHVRNQTLSALREIDARLGYLRRNLKERTAVRFGRACVNFLFGAVFTSAVFLGYLALYGR